MADQVIVVPTPINTVQIKGAIAYSAEHARIWAEGTDAQVEQLGGEHSAKGWAEATGQEGREYTDQKVAEAKQEMTNEINRQSLITLSQAESYADASVSTETGLRANADLNLQEQIDALSAASDVKDIVGTYAELEAYDTSTLGDNDIIKVLDDSTHGDAPSYYRWDTGTSTFTYIGSESASYTKAQADAKFLTQTSAASTYATQSSLATVATTGSYNDLTNKPTIPTGLPTQTGQSGKFLTTNGTNASWATVDALPSQTGNNGKFLTTNGTTASWATVQAGGGAPTLTWYTGTTGTTVTVSDTTGATLVKVYKNGLLLQPTEDYTISGTTLTLVTALVSTDKITVEVY